MNPKMHKPKHVIVKMPKVKDKERILKEEKEKQLVSYKGTPITLIWFLNRNFASLKVLVKNIQRDKKQGIEGYIKRFPDKEKLKKFTITKPVLHEKLKGFL